MLGSRCQCLVGLQKRRAKSLWFHDKMNQPKTYLDTDIQMLVCTQTLACKVCLLCLPLLCEGGLSHPPMVGCENTKPSQSKANRLGAQVFVRKQFFGLHQISWRTSKAKKGPCLVPLGVCVARQATFSAVQRATMKRFGGK
jgi:hypothetical protein